MLNDDFLILPGVKNTVGKLSALARTWLVFCAVFGVAEILCFSHDYPTVGIICGILSSFLLNLELSVLSILIIWCHEVLLLKRGYGFTRFFSYLSTLFATVYPVCSTYTIFTGKPLLLNYGLLPFISCILILFIHLINLPNMEAASRRLKIRLGVFPVFLLLIFLFDQPGLLLLSVIGKLALILLLAQPLRQLANIAPRVISMPEKESADE